MSQQANDREVLEGYVVDLACLRKYPEKEVLQRAEVHTTRCALMGHCIESGYGLVDHQGNIHPLDNHATPQVVSALEESNQEQGVQLRIRREMKEQEMQTVQIEEI